MPNINSGAPGSRGPQSRFTGLVESGDKGIGAATVLEGCAPPQSRSPDRRWSALGRRHPRWPAPAQTYFGGLRRREFALVFWRWRADGRTFHETGMHHRARRPLGNAKLTAQNLPNDEFGGARAEDARVQIKRGTRRGLIKDV